MINIGDTYTAQILLQITNQVKSNDIRSTYHGGRGLTGLVHQLGNVIIMLYPETGKEFWHSVDECLLVER